MKDGNRTWFKETTANEGKLINTFISEKQSVTEDKIK